MLPILEGALEAMSARRLRREALLSFISKDRALDFVCRKICGGPPRPKAQKRGRPPVLVAFGNGGTVSTTGCGYAPAPQARLRHRLKHVWGARVSLINEFRTSRCCCECGQVMKNVYKRHEQRKALDRPVLIRGILRCPTHDFCHRDKNAALNIMAVYEALAAKRPRPAYLCPTKGSRYA